MRLFIAFDTDDDAKKELSSIQKELKYAKLNLVKEFHLTLKFLGEVDEKKATEIKQRLKKVSFDEFDAQLSGIGVFPSEDYINVVWVGLEPKDKINELQKRIEDSLEGLFPKDTRFHSHITLARVKFIEDKKQFKDCLNNIKIEKITFSVERFRLMKSTLTPEGPVYEVLEEY